MMVGQSALACDVIVSVFEAACCDRWLDDIVTVTDLTQSEMTRHVKTHPSVQVPLTLFFTSFAPD